MLSQHNKMIISEHNDDFTILTNWQKNPHKFGPPLELGQDWRQIR